MRRTAMGMGAEGHRRGERSARSGWIEGEVRWGGTEPWRGRGREGGGGLVLCAVGRGGGARGMQWSVRSVMMAKAGVVGGGRRGGVGGDVGGAAVCGCVEGGKRRSGGNGWFVSVLVGDGSRRGGDGEGGGCGRGGRPEGAQVGRMV